MLKETHPLYDLAEEDGFKLCHPREVFEALKKAMPAPTPEGLLPLRNVVPYTEGRADGWKIGEHVRSAKTRNWPTFKPFEFHGQSIAIVGGAPSLGYTLHELRTLQKRGTKVMAINRTHDFLLDLPKTHGLPWIKPWAGIVLEAIPHASTYMRPTSGVRYYIGSQCHPQTFSAFEKSEHFIWHAQSKPQLLEHLSQEEIRNVVPAIGSTCGLRAIIFAYMMGFSDIHVFGMDSCYTEFDIVNGIRGPEGAPRLHAYRKPEAIHDVRELVVKGWDDGHDRRYWGNGNMLAQADEFQMFCAWRDEQIKLKRMDPHRVIVHGFGLIPDMARAWGLHADNFTSERKAA